MFSADFLHEILTLAEITKDLCMAEIMLEDTTEERERVLLDSIAVAIDAGLFAMRELDKLAGKN